MINLIILMLFKSLNFAMAVDDHCAYFKYCGSSATSSQGSSKSQPSTSIASSFNPSNISKVKGFGLETLFQPNNSLGFNIVSGTGKFGGALISPTMENGFFGNRTIELDLLYLQRRLEKKRFKNKKVNLALGASIISKPNYSLELGLSVKRNPDIKKINMGLGLSASLSIFTFGYAYYKDDSSIDLGSTFNLRTGNLYAVDYNTSRYQETFYVQTYSFGAKIKNLALDVGRISTKYKFYSEPTEITIYSAALQLGKFLFNAGYRQELSPNMKEEHQVLSLDKEKTDQYYGIQYMINSHIMLGAGYNTFLLKEVSGTLTLFL